MVDVYSKYDGKTQYISYKCTMESQVYRWRFTSNYSTPYSTSVSFYIQFGQHNTGLNEGVNMFLLVGGCEQMKED